jgi:hypothetical protein
LLGCHVIDVAAQLDFFSKKRVSGCALFQINLVVRAALAGW